jgi:hypothetical protein|tara:strand:- start:59 stop:295 length:237 start_codon:yes stop_codon:yes gene_type:complete
VQTDKTTQAEQGALAFLQNDVLSKAVFKSLRLYAFDSFESAPDAEAMVKAHAFLAASSALEMKLIQMADIAKEGNKNA